MREILKGIFTWGGPYPDVPWDLNGYAIKLDEGALIVDPPPCEESEWLVFDSFRPIQRIILTNRAHTRDVETFRARYSARIAAGADEVRDLAPLKVDEPLRDGDELAGGWRVVHLPGKSPGEIGLHKSARGILLLGDAIIGHPPGQLGLIPEKKLDNPAQLKQSLRKLLELEFEVLLLCDGKPVLSGARKRVEEFLASLV